VLYGLLIKPLDLMQAYRLEMDKTELTTEKVSLSFWGDIILNKINDTSRRLNYWSIWLLMSIFKAVKQEKITSPLYYPNFSTKKTVNSNGLASMQKKPRLDGPIP